MKSLLLSAVLAVSPPVGHAAAASDPIASATAQAWAASIRAGFASGDAARLQPVLTSLAALPVGVPSIQASLQPVQDELRAEAQAYVQAAAAPETAADELKKTALAMAAFDRPEVIAQIGGGLHAQIRQASSVYHERFGSRLTAQVRRISEAWTRTEIGANPGDGGVLAGAADENGFARRHARLGRSGGAIAAGRPIDEPPAAASAVPERTTMQLLGRFSKMTSAEAESVQSNPAFARALVASGLDPKNYSTPAASEFRAAVQRSDAGLIGRRQAQWKAALLAGGQESARSAGLKPAEVVTHGTTLKGLLGMLVSGGIEATSSYRGMSGEGARFWGGNGLDVGAGYAAKRGLYDGQPAVLILMRSSTLKVEAGGETLNRRPLVDGDFVGAVVYDGRQAVALDKQALQALARSAKAWQTAAVEAARAGKMREFDAWERSRDRLVPQ